MFMPMKGISRLPVENLLSHSTENFRNGTFLYFTKFLVSKKFMDKRGGCGGKAEEAGSIRIFCQILFLTVPKIFVGESLSVSLISGIEKNWGKS